MSASTANRTDLKHDYVSFINLPAYAQHIYSGVAIVLADNGTNASYAMMADDTASTNTTYLFMGFSQNEVDNSGGSNGDKDVQVMPIGAFSFAEFNASSPTDGWLGNTVYFADDNTVALSSTLSIQAGKCIGIIKTGSSGKVLVDCRNAGAI